MTALRRYLFVVVAVCVAFAAGIALGNGPLQGESGGDGSVSFAAANAKLGDEVRALRRAEAFDTALGSVSRPALLRGRLAGTSVGLFVLPGVSPGAVKALTTAVVTAGGDVAVVARLSASLVDPGKKTYVDSVATSSLEGAGDLKAAAALSTYPRIGALLARAYTGSSDALAVDDEATRIDAQLRGAKLVSIAEPLQRRASAVVVLTAGDHGTEESVYAAHTIEVQLVDALAHGADGLLVAGPGPASSRGGLISDVHASTAMRTAVATLDVLDLPDGKLAAVAALAAAVNGQPGAWGMRGGAPAVPPGFASGG